MERTWVGETILSHWIHLALKSFLFHKPMNPLYSSNHLLLPAVYRDLTDISAVLEFPVSDMARAQEFEVQMVVWRVGWW